MSSTTLQRPYIIPLAQMKKFKFHRASVSHRNLTVCHRNQDLDSKQETVSLCDFSRMTVLVMVSFVKTLFVKDVGNDVPGG